MRGTYRYSDILLSSGNPKMKSPLELVQSTWQVIVGIGQPIVSEDSTQSELDLQTLEDRVLYDASPLGVVMADVNESIETLEDINDQINDLNMLADFDSATPEIPTNEEEQYVIGSEAPVFDQARQLIVIDERVDDVQAFINDVLNNGEAGVEIDIVRLDPTLKVSTRSPRLCDPRAIRGTTRFTLSPTARTLNCNWAQPHLIQATCTSFRRSYPVGHLD